MKKCTSRTKQIHFFWFNRYLEEKIKLDYWWMDAGWYQVRSGRVAESGNLGSR